MKRLALFIATGALAVSACADPIAPPPDQGDDAQAQLPATAVAQIEALIAEKAARTPAQRKISSQLLYAASGRFAAATADTKDPARRITSLAQVDGKGRVLVDIKGDAAGLPTRIESVGGTVVDHSVAHASARAWIGLDQLETLAADPSVKAIRPAFLATNHRVDAGDARRAAAKHLGLTRAERVAAIQQAQLVWRTTEVPLAHPPAGADPITAAAIATGTAVSQGSKAHGADRARHFFNADGTGVNIGVLSDSDDHKEESIATGDLPADTVTVPGQSGRPGGGEGTAMMEIVHDVAPGAKLFFATAFTSPESFADNIRALRFTYHCDMIVDDVGYYFESPYEDDIVAQAVEDISADGGLYFSSAGNDGNYDDGTSSVWEGDFRAAGTLATLPSGYTVHDFGNKVISDRIEVSGGPVYLHWADPGALDAPASSNDYDLFVLDQDLRNVVLAATDVQDGDDLPFEYLGFTVPAGSRVVVAAHPGAAKRAIRVVVGRGEFGIATPGTTAGHPAAASAFGVAAVNVAEAGGGEFTGGPTTPVEVFSSDGPRRVFYDRHNNPYDPAKADGTFAGGGGQGRAKPDIAGADGVSTSMPGGSGLNPFFGTSAAAPHVAAIAALLKSAVPTTTADKIRAALLTSALDIEATSTDRDSGRGLASAFAAMQRLGAKPAVFLEAGTITVTPVFSDVVLPGGSAQVAVQLVNSGGANATAVTGVLSSPSPYVFVSGASATYGAIPVGGSATNATLYTFAVSPQTPCGEKLPFTLTVNYTGNGPHPVTIGFGVQTGRIGPGTTFSYAGPPVAVPDGDPSGVDVPITLTGGPIAKLTFRIDGTACSAAVGSTTVGVDHTWVGDLSFALKSPAGTSVTLIDAAGGPNNSGNNFCQTVLDDTATSSIENVTAAQAPFTGTFLPMNPQSAFVGQPADGTWILHVADSTFIDAGSVRAFSITVNGLTCGPAT